MAGARGEELLPGFVPPGYTQGMDSVRLGRALGIGARLAARTVRSALDAATAPNPAAASQTTPASSSGASAQATERSAVRPEPAAVPVMKRVVQAKAQVRQTGQGLKQGGRRFGEAIWGPFVKLGGVLWLEVTGVFFGLIALSVGLGAWKMRWALHATAANHEEHLRLLVAMGMAVVFGYFCLSSFLRAGRRGRRR